MNGASKSKQEDQDYPYGGLLVDLWEQTPAHYKHYIFNITIPDLATSWGEMLLELASKELPCEYKYIKILQHFLQQATSEEKHSIIYSQYGKELCLHLIQMKHFNILLSTTNFPINIKEKKIYNIKIMQ